MKRHGKIIALLICLIMSICSFGFTCGDNKEDGLSFSAFTKYTTTKTFEQNPQTFEAVYKIADDFLGRAGVLIGNYNGSNQAINLEIHEGGKPRLFYQDGAGKSHEFIFNYDSRTSDWIHLAVTWNFSTVKFYINGEFKKEASLKISQPPKIINPYAIGGDLRSDNSQYFKGSIKSLAVFSDVRSAEEILQDYTEFNENADNLLAYYQLSSDDLNDHTANGYNLKTTHDLIDNVNEPSEYEFSFMAIGDTQIVTLNYPDKLKNIYDYVLDNVQKKKVKHVFGLGDITDDDTLKEWNVAYEQISRMDGVVPYSVIRGNHDIYSAGRSMGVSSFFDTYFGKDDSPYANQYIDCYRGDVDEFKARNTVHQFSSSTRDYLVIALDYGPDDKILDWANSVAESYPNHNIIVTTHGYLTASGQYCKSGTMNAHPTRDYPNANNGDDIWEEFVSKHENIVMVICGHASTGKVLLKTNTGENGNSVAEILIDPQGLDESLEAMGMVATFYVSADGKNITVDYYSTVHNKYYKQDNQYSFQIETVERS